MLIPTSFEHLLLQGYTVMPTSMPPVLRRSYRCHVEHRAGTNRSFKNFIRISALEVHLLVEEKRQLAAE
jgi:hypothetical protein